MVFQLSDGYVTEGANLGQNHAQGTNAFFALGATPIVFAGCKLVFHHRVANYELEARGQLRRLRVQRPAIEQ